MQHACPHQHGTEPHARDREVFGDSPMIGFLHNTRGCQAWDRDEATKGTWDVLGGMGVG